MNLHSSQQAKGWLRYFPGQLLSKLLFLLWVPLLPTWWAAISGGGRLRRRCSYPVEFLDDGVEWNSSIPKPQILGVLGNSSIASQLHGREAFRTWEHILLYKQLERTIPSRWIFEPTLKPLIHGRWSSFHNMIVN